MMKREPLTGDILSVEGSTREWVVEEVQYNWIFPEETEYRLREKDGENVWLARWWRLHQLNIRLVEEKKQ